MTVTEGVNSRGGMLVSWARLAEGMVEITWVKFSSLWQALCLLLLCVTRT